MRFVFVLCATILMLSRASGQETLPKETQSDLEAKQKLLAARSPWTPELVFIPGGTFDMGIAIGEDRSRDYPESRPQHQVVIRPFAVGKYEVTFAEWDACVVSGGCNGYRPASYWGRGRQPVINVSWTDAQAYVAWLSSSTGQPYRLLSESEWEYVARAGTTTTYSFGATISPAQANFNTSQTREVGNYQANAFGLHDMYGNVFEWTQDCWNHSYKQAPVDGGAWTSGDCSHRVRRGGSWYYPDGPLRQGFRDHGQMSNRTADLGFRVARSL